MAIVHTYDLRDDEPTPFDKPQTFSVPRGPNPSESIAQMSGSLATERPYYGSAYIADLSRVLSKAHDGRSVSICSFLPDYPDVPMFRGPAEEIRRLGDPHSFTIAVFWEVLVDQAVYTVTGVESRWSGDHPLPLKLVGLLSTAGTNVHPAFLLFALSFGGFAHRDSRGFLALFRSTGDACLREAAARYHDAWPPVVDCMYGALAPGACPTSVRGFVPYGDRYRLTPEKGLINTLSSAARRVIRSSSLRSPRVPPR